MPKSTEVPHYIKDFNKLFESIAYRHEYNRVFEDFLSLTIKGFSFHGDFDKLNKYCQDTYSKKERETFGQLIYEWVRVMDRQINDDESWFDALGDYYQILASRGKKSAFGQFFTPSNVCDLMTALTGFKKQGALINDPCCGSGRLILSFHVSNPGNFYIAQDLDQMCCKMTAVNMCIHGAVGLVINQNSLTIKDILNAWVVNESLSYTGCPSIRKITPFEVNLFYSKWAKSTGVILKKANSVMTDVHVSDGNKPPVVMEEVTQLSLF